MLHIIQNDPEVPPGNIEGNLDASGIMYCVHHPYSGDSLPEMRDVSALIVLGGAMGADDELRHPFLSDLKEFVRHAVTSGIPCLGICLGGQLLASALGAAVVSNRWVELGCMQAALTQEGLEDALFAGIQGEFYTFQWHHDSFDIPHGGVVLASSSVCRHQAFRVGSAAWGIQFHPEVTEQIIRDWCTLSHTASAEVDKLLSDFRSIENSYRSTAYSILANFLSTAGLLTDSNRKLAAATGWKFGTR